MHSLTFKYVPFADLISIFTTLFLQETAYMFLRCTFILKVKFSRNAMENIFVWKWILFRKWKLLQDNLNTRYLFIKKKKNFEIILKYKSKFESKIIEKVFFTKHIALKIKLSNSHFRNFHLQKVLSEEQLLKVLFSNILTSFPQKRKKRKESNKTQWFFTNEIRKWKYSIKIRKNWTQL